jgi:hypothetical protein
MEEDKFLKKSLELFEKEIERKEIWLKYMYMKLDMSEEDNEANYIIERIKEFEDSIYLLINFKKYGQKKLFEIFGNSEKYK